MAMIAAWLETRSGAQKGKNTKIPKYFVTIVEYIIIVFLPIHHLGELLIRYFV